MRELVLAEYERIVQRKSTKILFLISIIFQIINFILFQIRWQIDTAIFKEGVEVALNSLNYPVMQLIDFNVLLVFVMLPLYFSESLSSELDSGAYKMVLLRPIKRWKLLVAKWISLATSYGLTLICVYLTKVFIGFMFLPKSRFTTYFLINNKLGVVHSIIYNLKYYLILFFIYLSILSITSLLSVVLRKPVLSFLGSSIFSIVLVYLFEPIFEILFKATDVAYYILAGKYNMINIYVLFSATIICFVISLWIWNRRVDKFV